VRIEAQWRKKEWAGPDPQRKEGTDSLSKERKKGENIFPGAGSGSQEKEKPSFREGGKVCPIAN